MFESEKAAMDFSKQVTTYSVGVRYDLLARLEQRANQDVSLRAPYCSKVLTQSCTFSLKFSFVYLRDCD